MSLVKVVETTETKSAAKTARQELSTATKLFRLKLRDARKGIIIVLVAMLALVIMNAVSAFYGFANSARPVTGQHFLDYSVLLLVLAPLAIAYIFWQEATGKNSVYPQTSISRFLSTQMFSLSLVLLALLVILALYFLIWAIISLLGLWIPNLILGYSFGADFLIAGFFAALVFLIMVTTGFSFLAVAVKAFRLYAVIPLIALVIFIQMYPIFYASRVFPPLDILNPVFQAIESIYLLFLSPATYASFVTACIVASVILLVASICIKLFKSDSDYDTNQTSWALALAYVPCVVVILFFGVSMYVDSGPHLSPSAIHNIAPVEPQTIQRNVTIREDAIIDLWVSYGAHHRQIFIPEYDDYFYVTEQNIIVNYDERFCSDWWYRMITDRVADTESPFVNRTLVFEYAPATFDKSSTQLLELTRPILLVAEGIIEETLEPSVYINIGYTGEGDVLFVPIWSMMGLIGENADNSRPRLDITAR